MSAPVHLLAVSSDPGTPAADTPASRVPRASAPLAGSSLAWVHLFDRYEYLSKDAPVRSSEDVEVKWGIHPPDDKRAEWTADDQRTTLVLLVRRNFRTDLTEASVTLEEQGDYLLWGPGIDPSWEALTDSIVLTVRWTSSPS